MKIRSKFEATNTQIVQAFINAGIDEISEITELTDGWFNRIYSAVDKAGKKYAIKFAPPKDAPILTYEKDMMVAEVDCYKLLAENTQIKIPKIVYVDFTETVVPTAFFIMEFLDGVRLDKAKLTATEKQEVNDRIAWILSEFHKLQGSGYGYLQIGLQSTWKDALIKMTDCLIKDSETYGKNCRIGKKLLTYIEKFAAVLEDVPCDLVNNDLHSKNIFYNKNSDGEIELAILDLERYFYGDPLGDFIIHEMGKPLCKKSIIKQYNKYAKKSILGSKEEEIRLYLLVAYLAAVMYTERFSRFNSLSKYFNIVYIEGTVCYKVFKLLAFNKLRKLAK